LNKQATETLALKDFEERVKHIWQFVEKNGSGDKLSEKDCTTVTEDMKL
jgi:hypothetical protein